MKVNIDFKKTKIEEGLTSKKVYVVTKRLSEFAPEEGTVFIFFEGIRVGDLPAIIYLYYPGLTKTNHQFGFDTAINIRDFLEYEEITEDFDLQFRF